MHGEVLCLTQPLSHSQMFSKL